MTGIHLVHLYAREMNIYGDTGNRLVLEQRLRRAGIPFRTTISGVGEPIPADAHLLLGGGGQDVGQEIVGQDLRGKRSQLVEMKQAGVPMLMICGMYQLFGEYFRTYTGTEIDGAGILGIFTEAQQERLIGNITVASDHGELVGYENHSGLTFLRDGVRPLGRVLRGHGNNTTDGVEGAVDGSVIGTYLHGPVLAKGPGLADHLLGQAIALAGLDAPLLGTDDLDALAVAAAGSAKARPI